MNDSNIKCGSKSDVDSKKKYNYPEIGKITVATRRLLAKLGVSPGWGTLIACLLGSGVAVLMSFSSSGCQNVENWRLSGEQGSITVQRDHVLGAVVISGKRHVSIEKEK